MAIIFHFNVFGLELKSLCKFLFSWTITEDGHDKFSPVLMAINSVSNTLYYTLFIKNLIIWRDISAVDQNISLTPASIKHIVFCSVLWINWYILLMFQGFF